MIVVASCKLFLLFRKQKWPEINIPSIPSDEINDECIVKDEKGSTDDLGMLISQHSVQSTCPNWQKIIQLPLPVVGEKS